MFTSIASRLRELRESYLRRLSLEREISAITSPGALADIEAAVSRCEMVESSPETTEMRRVLANRRGVLSEWG